MLEAKILHLVGQTNEYRPTMQLITARKEKQFIHANGIQNRDL